MKKTCIIIVGPTAVGKTALAIQLALRYTTQIISCDSRQCFKELNIGVAKPSAEDLHTVTHHFINSHSIQELVNVATFEKYALEKVNEIFTTQDVAVMVGGTGLYVKAFCDGMDEVPEVDAVIRQGILRNYENIGIEWLRQQIQQNDPAYFLKGEIQNPQRMMRALEVKLSSGKSILDFQTKQQKQRDFNIIKIGLELPRPELIGRINRRVGLMMGEGLLEEVRSLLPYQQLNALQTVGYRELFSYFNNEMSLEKAVESIKTNTRQYAKRQMTWFKKDAAIKWCKPDFETMLPLVNQ
ncbi:MAG: tRNA (adenosine(37)-N6)-dimethylallyltransferase MiaA [Chitinophagaceae bacterium]|nr:tRNA (adenosine(37)-N6)-dimethylallyltransferase MiaA [Chitinophagaceae bacterium]